MEVRTITCTPIGGLGNQLFIIAACIGAAERLGCEWCVPTSWTNHFMLNGDFNLKDVDLPDYIEPFFHYQEIPKTNVNLRGYFQSAKYFKHCEKLIRQKFAPKPEVKQKLEWKYRNILSKETCSLHVRRTDYLTLSDYHYNLEPSYYEGIQGMFPQFHFVCFSDDIAWCKENIEADFYVEDTLENEFHLMAMMKNNVIANSSFSWWAQFLNPNKNKLVFAPPRQNWFGKLKSHLNVNDLYCENFIYKR